MTPSQLERFMEKVVVPESWDACWMWSGCGMRKYGKFKIASYTLVSAHRASYEHFVGPIPDGLTIDHLCGSHRCVNPFHLEAVTLAENIRRHAKRQTHCCAGHEFTESNTYWYRGIHRRCRACQKTRYLKKAMA